MTDPYDPSLPRSSSDLGGAPGTGPRVPPGDLGSATGPAITPGAEPVAAPATGIPASGGRGAGSGAPAPGFNEKGHVRATKVSGVWIGLIATALFVILLIIFIAQNSRRVTLHFFGWHGQFSLALTILLSAVLGVLLVAIPGSLRIMQLRRALRKNVPGGRSLG
ncbi:LapA family protein [Jatrophihabitans sp.]|uniref:LapA family protein n=1 Tax=Jatrophihabitans sp. TaxID=1932789 RepID=UPI002EFDD5A2